MPSMPSGSSANHRCRPRRRERLASLEAMHEIAGVMNERPPCFLALDYGTGGGKSAIFDATELKRAEAALIEASRTGRVQSYKDDQSPTLTGTVTPGNRTQDAANGMCVVNTDYLADAGKGEKVFVKMCQQADGGWAPVVS